MLRVIISIVVLAASATAQAYTVGANGDQAPQYRGSSWLSESNWSSGYEPRKNWQNSHGSLKEVLAEIAQHKERWLDEVDAHYPANTDRQSAKDKWLDRLEGKLPEQKYGWLLKSSRERRSALRNLWHKRDGHRGGSSAVPLPAGVWLMLSGLGALIGWKKHQSVKATG